MGTLGFLLAALGMFACSVAIARLSCGMPAIPPLIRTGITRRGAGGRGRESRGVGVSWKVLLAAGVGGLGVWLVTGWIVPSLLAVFLIAIAPRMFGGGAAEKTSVAKLEALATWTESLRDTALAASGLETAIPATAANAPVLLREPLTRMTNRLAVRTPLPEALALLAEDLDDSGADMVVAALALNARQRAGSLTRVLTALAESTRVELEMRRRVMLQRNSVRRQAMQIAGVALILAAGQALFAPAWIAPYGTPVGQVALGILSTLYLLLVLRLRKLADPEPHPRFLAAPEEVMEAASYKPVGPPGRGVATASTVSRFAPPPSTAKRPTRAGTTPTTGASRAGGGSSVDGAVRSR